MTRPHLHSRVLRLAWLTVILALAPCVLLAGLLAGFAVTGRGTILAWGFIALALGFFLLRRALPGRQSRRWARPASALLSVAGATAVAWARFTGPNGLGGDAAIRIEHFAAGSGGALVAPRGLWLPEADLVSLGIGLAPYLDPLIDRTQAARLRALVMPRYAAIAADPALCDLGSALGSCFRELALLSFEDGHAIAVVPRAREARSPAAAMLVFLHGSGGNFAVYRQALATLATRHRIALVFPSFGAGNWQRPGGVGAVLEAKERACERFGLDPGRVYLAALSNGGRVVTRVLARDPGAFRGVALISAVIEDDPASGAGAGHLRGLPLLFVHGARDDRVPLAAVVPAVGRLEAAGAAVSRRVFSGEDHFLLLARLDEVAATLLEWMESAAPAAHWHRPR